MKKRFEGVFRRYEENPSLSTAGHLVESVRQSGDKKIKAEFADIPKHELYKSSGSAYSVLRKIAEEAPRLTSREEGAEINLGLKIEKDTMRVTVEVQSESAALITDLEKEIRHMVEDHHGTQEKIGSDSLMTDIY